MRRARYCREQNAVCGGQPGRGGSGREREFSPREERLAPEGAALHLVGVTGSFAAVRPQRLSNRFAHSRYGLQPLVTAFSIAVDTSIVPLKRIPGLAPLAMVGQTWPATAPNPMTPPSHPHISGGGARLRTVACEASASIGKGVDGTGALMLQW